MKTTIPMTNTDETDQRNAPIPNRSELMNQLFPKLDAEARILRDELINIAIAKPETWDDPGDFRAWAQSRARFALENADAIYR